MPIQVAAACLGILLFVGPGSSAPARAQLAGPTPMPFGGGDPAEAAIDAILTSYDATEQWRRRLRMSVLAAFAQAPGDPRVDPQSQAWLSGAATAVATARGPMLFTSAALAGSATVIEVELPSGQRAKARRVDQPAPASAPRASAPSRPEPSEAARDSRSEHSGVWKLTTSDEELPPPALVAAFALDPWPSSVVPLPLAAASELRPGRPALTLSQLGARLDAHQTAEVVTKVHLLTPPDPSNGEPAPPYLWVSDVYGPWGQPLLAADGALLGVTAAWSMGTSVRSLVVDASGLRAWLDGEPIALPPAFSAPPSPFRATPTPASPVGATRR